MPSLKWHQDQFANKGRFDFLYFTIVPERGITPNNLRIGLVPPDALTAMGNEAINAPADKVTLVKKIPCQRGAGYLIDQNILIDGKVGVHGHDGFKTFICAEPTSSMTENSSNCTLDHEQYSKHDVHSANYQRPCRRAIIVRFNFSS